MVFIRPVFIIVKTDMSYNNVLYKHVQTCRQGLKAIPKFYEYKIYFCKLFTTNLKEVKTKQSIEKNLKITSQLKK